MKNGNPLVCLVSCYYDTNYIRTTTLNEAMRRSSYDFVHLKNKSKGIKQYFEIIFDLVKTRITKNPDIYFLTFRGYEILPIVRLITLGKPLIYDEFINPLELVFYEQKIIKNKLIESIAHWGYRLWLNTVQVITTDTSSHADYSAEIMKINRDEYRVLHVSTDEKTFSPSSDISTNSSDDKFQVFYYGSMLPLHGVDIVLKAMDILKSNPNIELLMVGGKKKSKQKIASAINSGARIVHKEWIDYKNLPTAMVNADVCLGGPFGKTIQSEFVITGKTYQQLSMACPTIVGRNRESAVFSDRENAILVDQGDPEQLAEAILWACGNKDRLASIGEAGRELYLQNFSIDKLSRDVVGLLNGFVKEG